MALPDKRWRAAPAAGALGALALIGVAACTPPEDPSHGDAGGGAVAVAEPPLGPYVPFPAGWGFPRDRGTLEGWVDDVDIADIREWGWTLFAGVNQPAGHDGLTVWQTWWRVTQTFAPAPRPGPVGAEAAVAEIRVGGRPGRRRLLRPCKPPDDPGQRQRPDPPYAELYQHVRRRCAVRQQRRHHDRRGEIYNEAAFSHIRANGYYQQSVLQGAASRVVQRSWHFDRRVPERLDRVEDHVLAGQRQPGRPDRPARLGLRPDLADRRVQRLRDLEAGRRDRPLQQPDGHRYGALPPRPAGRVQQRRHLRGRPDRADRPVLQPPDRRGRAGGDGHERPVHPGPVRQLVLWTRLPGRRLHRPDRQSRPVQGDQRLGDADLLVARPAGGRAARPGPADRRA